MHIPSLKLISQSTLKKSPENSDGRTDGRTDGQTDGHCHSIIRPFFKRAYKKNANKFGRKIANESEDHNQPSPKLAGILTVADELWCGQTQNRVKFDFQVKFDLEGQGRSSPKP